MAEVVSKQQLINAGVDAENLGKFMNDAADTPNDPHSEGTLVTRTGSVIYNLAKLQELHFTPIPKPAGNNDKILSVVNNTLAYIDTFNFKLIDVGDTLPIGGVYDIGSLYFKEDESIFYEWNGAIWQSAGTPAKNQAFVLGNSSQYVWNGTNLVSIGSGGGGSSGNNIVQWNLLDYKLTDHLLTDEESKGWLIQGSQTDLTEHTDVNAKIKEAYDTGTTKEFTYKYNFVNKHCKIDENFIASDFYPNAYVTFNKPFLPGTSPWKIVVKAKTPQSWINTPALFASHGYKNFEYPLLRFESGKIRLYLSSTGTSWNITGGTGLGGITTFAIGTWYTFSLEFTGTQYIVKYSTDDGATWNVEATLNSTLITNHPQQGGATEPYYLILGNRRFGVNNWDDYWDYQGGSIDLKGTEIYIDNQLYWSYADSFEYRKAQNGWCIAAETEKVKIEETYNLIGHGWFYILHNDGSVSLPKTKNFFRIADKLENVNEYLQDQIVNLRGYMVLGGTVDIFGLTAAKVMQSGSTGFDFVKESEVIRKSSSSVNNTYAANAVLINEAGLPLEFDASMAVNTGDQVQPRSVSQFLYFCVDNVFAIRQILQAGSGINIYNDTVSAFNITTNNIDKAILTDSIKQIPTDSTLASDTEIPTTKAVALALENFSGSGISYKGDFDASKSNYDALEDIQEGDIYQVSVAGIIDTVKYEIGDILMANSTIEGIPVTAELLHYAGGNMPSQILTAGSGINIANDIISVNNIAVSNIDPMALTTSVKQIPAVSAASDAMIPTTRAVAAALAKALESYTANESTYKGSFDASQGNYNALADIQQGDMYKVSVAGTINGITYAIGDSIIANKNVTGIPVTADLDHYVTSTATSNIILTDFAPNVITTNLANSATASNDKLVTEKGIATALEALNLDVSDLVVADFATGVVKTAIANVSSAADDKLVTEKAIATALAALEPDVSDLTLANFATGVVTETLADTDTASNTKIVTELAIAKKLDTLNPATVSSGWSLFDRKHSSFVLEGDAALGWLEQGSTLNWWLYPAAHEFLQAQYDNAVAYTCSIPVSNINGTDTVLNVPCVRATNGMMFVEERLNPINNPARAAYDAYDQTGIMPFFLYNSAGDFFKLPINEEYWRPVLNSNALGLQNHDSTPKIEGGMGNVYIRANNFNDQTGPFVKTGSETSIAWGSNSIGSKNSLNFNSGLVVNTGNRVRPASQNEFIYYYVGNTVTGVWPLDLSGILTLIDKKADKTEISGGGGAIVGGILMFSGTFVGKHPVPTGTTTPDTSWALCDGTNGTPDLRDKFIIGAGISGTAPADNEIRDTGGQKTTILAGTTGNTTLTIAQLASHTHTAKYQASGGATPQTSGYYGESGSAQTASTGGNGSHSHSLETVTIDIMPPYYALAFIMKIS